MSVKRTEGEVASAVPTTTSGDQHAYCRVHANRRPPHASRETAATGLLSLKSDPLTNGAGSGMAGMAAIPIRDAAISLVLIPKKSLLHYFFHSTSLPITFTNRHLNSAYLPTY